MTNGLLPTEWEMVSEFHYTYELPIRHIPALPATAETALRYGLLEEEFLEYRHAELFKDLVGIADALADMAYVIHGTALAYGIPLEEVMREVHRSNMSKLGEDGRPIFREDGKVLKGPLYTPPAIKEILERRQARVERGPCP